MPELPVVHPEELVEPPVVVLQVTEREESVGIERGDERGDLVGAARALAVALAERLAGDVADRNDLRRRRCGAAVTSAADVNRTAPPSSSMDLTNAVRREHGVTRFLLKSRELITADSRLSNCRRNDLT